MTNPLPESAVELAAMDMCVRDGCMVRMCEKHYMAAKRALTAALPAIREAVVGEFKGLVEAAKQVRSLAELGALEGAAFKNDSPALNRLRTEINALTEQENRNG